MTAHRCRRIAGWPLCGECGLPMPVAADRVGRRDLDGQRDPETFDRDMDDNPDDIVYGVLRRREDGRP